MHRVAWLLMAFAAVGVLLAAHVWPQGQPPRLVSANSDAFMYHLPVRAYAFEALRSGRLPTWNPHVLGGQPFLATHQAAALYPGNFPHWFLPPGQALGLVIALHVLWAALGMYLWLGRWGHPPAARALGAVTFAFTVTGVRTLAWPHVLLGSVWLPWLCMGVDAVAARPTPRRAAGLAGACTCLLLSGYIQGAVYLYYAAVPYAVFRWWQTRDGARGRRAAWLAAGLFVLPLLTAAAQLMPLVELALRSARPAGGLTADAVRSMGYVPGSAIVRGLLGGTGARDAALLMQPLALTWLLALAACWARPHRSRLVFWVVAGGVAAVLAAGFDTPLYPLYFALPTGGVFRVPVRLLVITACALSVLTSAGASTLIQMDTHRLPRRFLTGLGFAATTVLVVVSRDVLFGVASLACWLAWVLRPQRSGIIAVAAVGLVAWQGVHTFPPTPYLPWHGPPPFPDHSRVATFLHERVGHDRVHVYRSHTDWRTWTYPANWGMDVHLRQLTAYESLPLQQVDAAFAHLERGAPHTSPLPFVGGLELRADSTHPEWFHLWSVRWIVIDRFSGSDDWGEQLETRLGLQRVHVGEEQLLYNPHALPRAYWVPRAEPVPPDRDVWAALAADTFDPHAMVFIQPPAPEQPAGVAGTQGNVTFVRDEDTDVELHIASNGAGWVVLTDAWYPGWQATIDGAPAPILVANGVFRAVRLPAGEHTLRFRYRPLTLRAGIAGSLLGLLLLGACIAFGGARQRG